MEPHPLDINDDAIDSRWKPVRGAAQDPRVARLVAAAFPIVPDLRAVFRKVPQDESGSRVKGYGAVPLGDAGMWGQNDVAFGRGSDDEGAFLFGGVVEAQLESELAPGSAGQARY